MAALKPYKQKAIELFYVYRYVSAARLCRLYFFHVSKDYFFTLNKTRRKPKLGCISASTNLFNHFVSCAQTFYPVQFKGDHTHCRSSQAQVTKTPKTPISKRVQSAFFLLHPISLTACWVKTRLNARPLDIAPNRPLSSSLATLIIALPPLPELPTPRHWQQ